MPRSDLRAFLRTNKRWWLAPMIAVLVVLALLIVLGAGPSATFVYTLF